MYSAAVGEFETLVSSIVDLHHQTQDFATKAVNVARTLRNWLIGYRIMEFEQQGQNRATYGDGLMERLAKRLASSGLTRVTPRELRRYRLFYQVYPRIWESMAPGFVAQQGFGPLLQLLPPASPAFRESVTPERQQEEPDTTPLALRLSFTHLNELIQLPDETQRRFYEIESIRGNWSVRELRRQIASLYYQRSGLSKDKTKLSAMTLATADVFQPAHIIRDPYVFEFLGLRSRDVMSESDLEDALQKRILKCHILVEIKTDAFRHEHLGQLNAYVAYYKKHQMTAGDQAPIGILLCTHKNDALVEFALGDLSNQIFVSRYAVELPKKEEMERFITKISKEMGT